jgi:TPR repeat protein
MTKFKFLLFLALLVGFAPLAYAGFDEGRTAFDTGDYAAAYREFKSLSEQGNLEAQDYLGGMYALGHGVPQDFVEAVKWFRKAAEQGYDNAQNNLGWMYEHGEGVPQDLVLAHMWFNLAAAQGHRIAEDYRDNLAKKMTPSQIAEAQRLAREWKPKGRY